MASNENSATKSNQRSSDKYDCDSIKQFCAILTSKHGEHSTITVRAAGFEWMGNEKDPICKQCGLQVSEWPSDITPFQFHAQRSPTCSFVRRLLPSSSIDSNTASTMTQQNAANKWSELTSLMGARTRSFSHWPTHSMPTSAQMIAAGFFSCRVGDRVICLYCNLICQQWRPQIDDPCQVHRSLSPKCIYVRSILNHPVSSIIIVNASNDENEPKNQHSNSSMHYATTQVHHSNYVEIPRRLATFATWPKENHPSVDHLVRAGFFYSGTGTAVTCFYCDGSLQNWGANDNPMIEHARWFPHCSYARQLCGDDLYGRIQQAKARDQDRSNGATNSLQINDNSVLSRIVSARLDLTISRRLLGQSFSINVIKRCWEDQFRLNGSDFAEEIDLWLACTILQRQIDHIAGKKENILVPSVAMAEETVIHQPATSHNAAHSNNGEANGMSESSTSDSSISPDDESKKKIKTDDPDQFSDKPLRDPCVICFTEERRLAYIPCGHLSTCVPCGHSLRLCPMCRQAITGFMRIYI